jgi:hypothetical protein
MLRGTYTGRDAAAARGPHFETKSRKSTTSGHEIITQSVRKALKEIGQSFLSFN